MPGGPRCVLVLAGLDPSGGAGLLADALTIAAHGHLPLGVATALTVQDAARCHAWVAVDASLLARQIGVLVGDRPIAAIKVGMAGSAANARAIAAALAPLVRDGVPLVLDPVLRASVGSALLVGEGAQALEPLLALATLCTPNADEAHALTGVTAGDPEGQARAASALRALGPAAVLVKGGHGTDPDTVTDVLDDGGPAPLVLASPRLPGPPPHGTGCALASEIAALLATGAPLRAAVTQARARLVRRIAAAHVIGAGRPVLGRLVDGT